MVRLFGLDALDENCLLVNMGNSFESLVFGIGSLIGMVGGFYAGYLSLFWGIFLIGFFHIYICLCNGAVFF